MDNIFKNIIDWTNLNSGFLSLIIFLVTIFVGWVSGAFNALFKKPKLKIRFIGKMSFYSFYYTGDKHFHKELNETFDYHKTGFVVYMSIANIGNANTTIDKIFLGYYTNGPKKYFFKDKIVWLPQWHSIEPFRIRLKDDSLLQVASLRMKDSAFDKDDKDKIEVGSSLVGAAYFEQPEAWGNLNPKQLEDNFTKVIIKIRDIYGYEYKFKTKLKSFTIEKARKFNPHFGNAQRITETTD